MRTHSRILRAVCATTLLCLVAAGVASAAPNDTCGLARDERCTLWESTYAGTGNGPDRGQAIALDPFGGPPYVGGRTAGSGSDHDFLTMAPSASGVPSWASTYNGPGNGLDQVRSIAVDPLGLRVFVTGESLGSDGFDYATIAYAAIPDGIHEPGDQVWVARYDSGTGADRSVDLAVSPDGSRVYVTGYSENGNGIDLDGVTIAYDAETGGTLWEQRYNGPANWWDVPTALAVAPAGEDDRVIVTMRSNVGGTGNDQTAITTIAYDGGTGSRSWTHDHNPSLRDYPYDVVVSRDGQKAFVVGESQDPTTGFDFATIALNAATGAQSWVSRYDGGINADDRALAIDVTPDGSSVFVTGFSPEDLQPVQRAAATIAYDAATGAQRWVSRFVEPGGNAGSDVFVSPDGQHVYVTGLSVGQAVGAGANQLGGTVSVSSMLTLGYAAGTGAQEWLARYRTDGGAAAGAVSPDGTTVFVTGGEADAVTVAYDSGVPAPAVPVPTTISPPPFINAANVGAVTVTGTARTGDNVIVALSDGPHTTSGQVYVTDGTYSVTLTASGLDDGPIEARARAYRIPDGHSDFIRTTVTKDTVVAQPTVRVVRNPLGGSSVTNASIDGSAEPGSTVAVTLADGSVTVASTATASATGSYQATVDASGLADGTITASASATDPAGNVSLVRTASATKDTVAPASPVVLTPADGATIGTSTVMMSGTAEPGASISIKEGTTSLAIVTADPNGSWSATRSLRNGAHEITVRATDPAGNISTGATRAFSVSAVGPKAPVILTPQTDTDQPRTFTVTGSAPANTTVTLLDGTKAAATKTVTGNGQWSVSVTLSAGAHTLTATARDIRGNASPASDAVVVNVDVAVPIVKITTANRSVQADGTSVTGTATDDKGVRSVRVRFLSLTGDLVATLDADCPACGVGAQSVAWSVAPELDPGTYRVETVAFDGANLSGQKSIDIITL